MTTLSITLLTALTLGIILVIVSVTLRRKTEGTSKPRKALRITGAILVAGSLLPLPYLASTNQLSVLVTNLGANWPIDGYAENITNENEDIYSGHFKEGLYHGEGALYYESGSVYEGTFENGLRSGTGTYTDISGFTYTGQWEKDHMQGEGIYTYKDGSVYTDSCTGDYV